MQFANKFVPATIYDNSSYLTTTKLMDDSSKLSKVTYCRRESSLPDHFMSHLRIFVVSWEMGLDGVQDNAVKLCNAALRVRKLIYSVMIFNSFFQLKVNFLSLKLINYFVNKFYLILG